MLKAEGKGQNKSFAFRFFVVMQHYECTIRHTPTDKNLNLTTNLKQATNRFMKSFKIR